MIKSELFQPSLLPPLKQQTRSKPKIREEGKMREHDSMCIDAQELRHLQAIRPYVTKERKTSKRENKASWSPHESSKSKGKKLQGSGRKIEDIPCQKNVVELYGELMALKSQYKNLRSSYGRLVEQKQEITNREYNERMVSHNEIERCNREIERQRGNIELLQREIDRIKKECYKIVETERFKMKKLEETLQEKELMIAYLRSENEKCRRGESTASTANQTSLYFLQSTSPIFGGDYLNRSNANSSLTNNVVIETQSFNKGRKPSPKLQEDSLSFSRDKSNHLESVHSAITNHNDYIPLNATKKEFIILQSGSSAKEECLTCQQGGQGGEEMKKGERRKGKGDSSDLNSRSRDTITVGCRSVAKDKMGKMNTRRFQLMLDENVDLNLQSSFSTKKRGLNSSGVFCKQKKKMTSKKRVL